jgi:hypothetical protein
MPEYTWEQLMIPGVEWEHELILGPDDTFIAPNGRTLRGPKEILLWQKGTQAGMALHNPQLEFPFEEDS